MSSSPGLPTRVVHESHVENLTARTAVASADDPAREGAHRELQQAVAGYFEALRPYLTESKAGKEYYHGQLPESATDDGVAILGSTMHQAEYGLDKFDDPPAGANPRERYQHIAEQLPAEDNERVVDLVFNSDSVTVVYEKYQAGLRHLEGVYSNRTKTTKQRDEWLPSADPVEQTQLQLMDLDMLMRASRVLDEAAHELGFLPSSDERDKNTFAVGE